VSVQPAVRFHKLELTDVAVGSYFTWDSARDRRRDLGARLVDGAHVSLRVVATSSHCHRWSRADHNATDAVSAEAFGALGLFVSLSAPISDFSSLEQPSGSTNHLGCGVLRLRVGPACGL
jgi:hypothetical protein